MTAALIATLSFACSKNDSSKPSAGSSTTAGSDSTTAGSGSAMMAGGSAVVASGSGSDSGAGSGSGSMMAGSAGSGAGMMAATGSAGAGSGAGSGSGGFDFDKLDHKAQAQFMKDHVVDDMRVAFQTFDAKKYKNFDCKTCHGKDPKATHFKMPTPDLPKLDFAAIQAGKQKPKTVEFMEKTVKPQMAKILHQTEFDPVTKTGQFGCLECHEQKK